MPARRRPKPTVPPPLPRSFRAGGVRWSLTNGAAGWGKAVAIAPGAMPASALTIETLAMVAVEPGLPLAVERAMVWHELVHVAFYVAGWRQQFAKADDTEEAVAWALTFVGLAIMRDNRSLRAYLFGA